MAKTHSNTKAGIAGIAIVGAALLSNVSVLVEKIQAAGTVAKESLCVVQDVAGGVINSNLLDCSAAAKTPASTGSSIDGD